MPNLKLQVSRALSVIPSGNTNIPIPNIITQGSATSTSAGILIDSTKNFSSSGVNPLNVQIGDIVYNTTSSTAAMVTNVDSATQLTLNFAIGIISADNYTLYLGTNTAGSIEPCVLYVGTGGEITVTTAGGDVVNFIGIASGTFLPVQAIKVHPISSATDIIALW
jgi:hypothetical protein